MEPAAGVEGRGGEIKERAWGGEGGEKADKLERAEGEEPVSFSSFLPEE